MKLTPPLDLIIAALAATFLKDVDGTSAAVTLVKGDRADATPFNVHGHVRHLKKNAAIVKHTADRTRALDTQWSALQEKFIRTGGAPAIIGNFFNPVENQFISSASFFRDEVLEYDKLAKVNQSNTVYEFSISDNFEATSNVFNLGVEAKMSFMGGLIKVSGAMSLLQSSKSTTRTIRALGKLEFQDEYYEIPTDTLYQIDYPAATTGIEDEALYVITGLQYGSLIAIDCSYTYGETDNVQEVKGALNVAMKGLSKAVNVAAGADFDYSETERRVARNLDCSFVGDINLTGEAPRDFAGYIDLFTKAPDQRVSRPVMAKLKPTSKIQLTEDKLLCNVYSDILTATTETYNDLLDLSARARDVRKSALRNSISGILDRVSKFEPIVSKRLTKFQETIQNDLPRYRRTCEGLQPAEIDSVREALAPLASWLSAIEEEIAYMGRNVDIIKQNFGATKEAINELPTTNETTVVIVRTAFADEDPYLRRILNNEGVVGMKPTAFFKRNAAKLLDTLDILHRFKMGGQLAILVDPPGKLFATDVKLGFDLIGFHKEDRIDEAKDHARRIFQVRSIYGPSFMDWDRRLQEWFDLSGEGNRAFESYVITDGREAPLVNSVHWGDVVDNLVATGPHNISVCDDIEVWVVRYYENSLYRGTIGNIRAWKDGSVVFSLGDFENGVPYLQKVRGYQYHYTKYMLKEGEVWDGVFIVSMRPGGYDPVLFVPVASGHATVPEDDPMPNLTSKPSAEPTSSRVPADENKTKEGPDKNFGSSGSFAMLGPFFFPYMYWTGVIVVTAALFGL